MKTSVPSANRKPKNLNSNLIDGSTPGRSRDAGCAGLPSRRPLPRRPPPYATIITRNHAFRRPVLWSNFVRAGGEPQQLHAPTSPTLVADLFASDAHVIAAGRRRRRRI